MVNSFNEGIEKIKMLFDSYVLELGNDFRNIQEFCSIIKLKNDPYANIIS